MNTETRDVYEENISANGEVSKFLRDVLKGLERKPKKLDSKYFYDAKGDKLFQHIMDCPEYYITRCEAEIFSILSEAIAAELAASFEAFDLIELGAGDASKTVYLLQELLKARADFKYFPVDISRSIIDYLQYELPNKVPGLDVEGLNGEYVEMLKEANRVSGRRKVVLFLGSNIGNMDAGEALNFLIEVRTNLNPGDKLLIGFDLKKHPAIVFSAYNDHSGYTKAFNLNLLERINRELGGNFELSRFDHYPTYDPITGACKSYLVSNSKQQVLIAGRRFMFEEGEVIVMELSQKYDLQEIESLAKASGCSFSPRARTRPTDGSR